MIAVGLLFTVLLELHSKNGRMWHVPDAAPVYLFYTLPVINTLWSQYPHETLFRGASVLINIFIFYLSAHANWHSHFTSIQRLVLWVPGTLLLSAVMIFANFGTFRSSDVTGSYSNHAASFAILCVPFLLALRIINGKRRFYYMLGLSACVIIVFISLSRAALVLLGVSLLLSVFFVPGKLDVRVSRLLKWLSMVLGVGGILVLLLGYDETVGRVIERITSSQVFDLRNLLYADETLDDFWRAAMYSSGIAAIKEYPIWGIGYGGLIRFMELEYGYGLVSHNLVITYWGEMGLVGFAALVWFLWRIFFMQISMLRDQVLGRYEAFLIAAVSSASTIALVHSFFRPIESNYMFPVVLGVLFSLHTKRKALLKSRDRARSFDVQATNQVHIAR